MSDTLSTLTAYARKWTFRGLDTKSVTVIAVLWFDARQAASVQLGIDPDDTFLISVE